MIVDTKIDLERDPLRLFRSLFEDNSLQILEWSLKITSDKVETRCKPTFYVYHKADDLSVYEKLNVLLEKLGCPVDVLKFQQNSIGISMYNGIRVPLLTEDYKCLYIHKLNQNTIDAFRWQNELTYEKVNYIFKTGFKKIEVQDFIHPELDSFFRDVMKTEEAKNRSGIWLQKLGYKVQEVYLAFPNRPKLKWIFDLLKDHIFINYFENTLAYSNLRCKNIGFDGLHEENPAITVYFSIPISHKFPNTYVELMNMTHEFFAEIKS